MWTRLLLALVLIGVNGCTYNYFVPSGEAACLEVPRGDDRFGVTPDYERWLRFWQSTAYCQAVRARWFANNQFVPPAEIHLLNVGPLQCARLSDNTIRVTARFTPPAGTPNVDPFDVLVGSDPTQAPSPSNVGRMQPVDANGNDVGAPVAFPQDLMGNYPVSLPATIAADVVVAPNLVPPPGQVRIIATVSAKQVTQAGVQIIGRWHDRATRQPC